MPQFSLGIEWNVNFQITSLKKTRVKDVDGDHLTKLCSSTMDSKNKGPFPNMNSFNFGERPFDFAIPYVNTNGNNVGNGALFDGIPFTGPISMCRKCYEPYVRRALSALLQKKMILFVNTILL